MSLVTAVYPSTQKYCVFLYSFKTDEYLWNLINSVFSVSEYRYIMYHAATEILLLLTLTNKTWNTLSAGSVFSIYFEKLKRIIISWKCVLGNKINWIHLVKSLNGIIFDRTTSFVYKWKSELAMALFLSSILQIHVAGHTQLLVVEGISIYLNDILLILWTDYLISVILFRTSQPINYCGTLTRWKSVTFEEALERLTLILVCLQLEQNKYPWCLWWQFILRDVGVISHYCQHSLNRC